MKRRQLKDDMDVAIKIIDTFEIDADDDMVRLKVGSLDVSMTYPEAGMVYSVLSLLYSDSQA